MSALNVTSDLFSNQAVPKSQSYGHSVVTPYLFHEKSSVEMPEGLSIFLRLPYSITTLPRIRDTARHPDTQQAYDGEWLHWGWSGTHMGGEGIKEKGGEDQKTTRSPRGGVMFRHSGRGDNEQKLWPKAAWLMWETLPVVPLRGGGSGRWIIQGLNFKGLLDSIHSYSGVRLHGAHTY